MGRIRVVLGVGRFYPDKISAMNINRHTNILRILSYIQVEYPYLEITICKTWSGTFNAGRILVIFILQNTHVLQCCCQISQKLHARLARSTWNQLLWWDRPCGVKWAVIPLWHINLYGQLTLERWSGAPQKVDSAWFQFSPLSFLHTLMKL